MKYVNKILMYEKYNLNTKYIYIHIYIISVQKIMAKVQTM